MRSYRQIIVGVSLLVGTVLVGGYFISNAATQGDRSTVTKASSQPSASAAETKPMNPVVLTGDSIVELWSTSYEDLLPVETVNIAISGSVIEQWRESLHRSIVPLVPRIILIHIGTNDIANTGENVPAGIEFAGKALTYFEEIHAMLPSAEIYYTSILESPSQVSSHAVIRTANTMIESQSAVDPLLTFIDLNEAMGVGLAGVPATYFVEDGLHLNANGYKVLQQAIGSKLS